jgi:hypothetical protein
MHIVVAFLLFKRSFSDEIPEGFATNHRATGQAQRLPYLAQRKSQRLIRQHRELFYYRRNLGPKTSKQIVLREPRR